MRAISALVFTLMLASCQTAGPEVTVEDTWIRLAAVPDQPAAAYFTLHGATTDDTLIAVHNDNVLKTELHETMAAMPDMKGMGGMSMMKPLATVAVPAGATVAFVPGGKHVMLFGMSSAIKPGSKTVLTLVFKSGLQLAQNASVVAAGEGKPGKR